MYGSMYKHECLGGFINEQYSCRKSAARYPAMHPHPDLAHMLVRCCNSQETYVCIEIDLSPYTVPDLDM